MQRFLSITLALFIGLSFSIDAEARRFGGGKSWGSAPRHQPAKPQQQRQQQQQPAQQAGKQAAAGGGASKWLGPLAGIAAGGLLASMLFGEGFEGFKFLDILIFAGIAFMIFKLLAARRRPQMQPMGAGGPMQREMPAGASNPFGNPNSMLGGSASAPVIQAPAWFNADSFLAAAREHFNQLQLHWDANEMDKIAEYVTPEMLGYLQKERSELGEGYQSTYIDNLDVQLDGVEELDGYTLATLSFTGISKTSRFDQGEAFSESWRMERKQGDNQPWLVAGIRQNA